MIKWEGERAESVSNGEEVSSETKYLTREKQIKKIKTESARILSIFSGKSNLSQEYTLVSLSTDVA